MIIAANLALALQALIDQNAELLLELNNYRAIDGMDEAAEDESVQQARNTLEAFKAEDASLRWHMDPERSTLIAAIEVASDAEEERDARNALEQFDAENPGEERDRPTPEQWATYLGNLATKHAEATAPNVLLNLLASELRAAAVPQAA